MASLPPLRSKDIASDGISLLEFLPPHLIPNHLKKSTTGMATVARRSRMNGPRSRDSAAMCIQLRWRQYRACKIVRALRTAEATHERAWAEVHNTLTQAAVVLQKVWRGHRQRKLYARWMAAEEDGLHALNQTQRRQVGSASIIQRWWRGLTKDVRYRRKVAFTQGLARPVPPSKCTPCTCDACYYKEEGNAKCATKEEESHTLCSIKVVKTETAEVVVEWAFGNTGAGVTKSLMRLPRWLIDIVQYFYGPKPCPTSSMDATAPICWMV